MLSATSGISNSRPVLPLARHVYSQSRSANRRRNFKASREGAWVLAYAYGIYRMADTAASRPCNGRMASQRSRAENTDSSHHVGSFEFTLGRCREQALSRLSPIPVSFICISSISLPSFNFHTHPPCPPVFEFRCVASWFRSVRFLYIVAPKLRS